MGIPCVGYILAMDAQRTLDQYPLGVLQLLSSCPSEAMVGRQADGISWDSGICSGDVYVSWGELINEKLTQFLKDK